MAANEWAAAAAETGVVPSSEVTKTSETLSPVLEKIISTHFDEVVKKTEATSVSEDCYALENELRTLIENNGKLDSRSSLGQKFAREVAKDPTLKKERSECKSKADLDVFRMSWASKKYNDIQQKKTKTESLTELAKMDAEYCGFSRIVWREGSTHPHYICSLTFSFSLKKKIKVQCIKAIYFGKIPQTVLALKGSYLSSIELPLCRQDLPLPPTCLDLPRLAWTCLA